MSLMVYLAIIPLQYCVCGGFDWCSLTCEGGEKHTMCVYKAEGSDKCKGVMGGLTAEEIRVIVDYHNELRAKVANGRETRGAQPPAADMNQLVWDEEVAMIAQRWADQCDKPSGHDQCRITRDNVMVGQNVAEVSGYGITIDRISAIKELIKSWYDEVKEMDSSLVAEVQFEGPVIGHYTQLVWSKTTRLGCGLAHKQEADKGPFDVRLICNYKIAGNFIGQPVYIVGATGSKCWKNSTEYPGLCEPQEDEEKQNMFPINSSPLDGDSSGILEPVKFDLSGFNGPSSSFDSPGFSESLFSTGVPQGPIYISPHENNPSGKLPDYVLGNFFNTILIPSHIFRNSLIPTPDKKEDARKNLHIHQVSTHEPVVATGRSSSISQRIDHKSTSHNTNFQNPIQTSDFKKFLAMFDWNE